MANPPILKLFFVYFLFVFVLFQMKLADGDMNKLCDTVVSRIDIGAKVATQAIKAIVEVEGGRFDDSMKKATIEMINEKYDDL